MTDSMVERVARAAFVMLAVVGLSACDNEPVPRPTPKFREGQYVQSKIGGYRGMVIGVACWGRTAFCYYDVRFPAMELRTDVSLMGRDGPIQIAPLATVRYVREYEIERADP